MLFAKRIDLILEQGHWKAVNPEKDSLSFMVRPQDYASYGEMDPSTGLFKKKVKRKKR